MDIVGQVLSLAPVPYLSTAWSIFGFIVQTIQTAQASKEQLDVLSCTAAQLLLILDREYRSGRLIPTCTLDPLNDLRSLLIEISTFVQREVGKNFFKLLFMKDLRIAKIEGFHRQLGATISAFQISSLLDTREWQHKNDYARIMDQEALNHNLSSLQSNQKQMMHMLNAQQNNAMATMVSLQRRLDQRPESEIERRFLSSSLQYLSTSSGRMIEMEDWMVTTYEVEIGYQIGSGGFGRVFKGVWNKTVVAVKVLQTTGGVTPSSNSIRNEIKTWSRARHPHILQFLGANVLEGEPFLVMPYLKNGNARDYLEKRPAFDRLRLLQDVSLGLIYLHSQRIIHGDLKALNILIDDSLKAVLCDFGLSRIRADAASRTAISDATGAAEVAGSRNWMAPERLMRGSLRKPCDIYSFGMTIYEIYTGEIPLGDIHHGDFTYLIVKENIRPERPDEEEAPELSGELWSLAELCWGQDPKKRPTAEDVHEILMRIPILPKVVNPIPTQSPPTKLAPKNGAEAFPLSPLDLSVVSNLSSIASPLSVRMAPTSPRSKFSQKREMVKHSRSGPSPGPHVIELTGLTRSVMCVVYSSDGQRIASCSYDLTVRVWDAKTGRITLDALLKGYSTHVNSVAFSPDDTQMAYGDTKGVTLLWDVDSGELVENHLPTPEEVNQVAFTPDGTKLACAADNGIYVWNAENLHLICGPVGQTGVCCFAFSPNGRHVLSCSDKPPIRMLDAKTGKSLETVIPGLDDVIYDATFSPDGTRILAASRDGSVRVFQAKTGVASAEYYGHSGAVYAAAYSPDGRFVASVGEDKTVQVWEATTGGLVRVLNGHQDKIYAVVFSPDGSRILTASLDKTIRQWLWDQTDATLPLKGF